MRQPSFRPVWLLPIVLWLVLGGALALITSRVADWFVMTDELLYERLALSVVRLGSPLPHVHGQSVPNINQLYPLILATVYRGGDVAHDLASAHVLNAFVMSSAALPAYFLARRVAGSPWVAALAAVLTVATPWIVLSSFLMTEVSAYPVFLWTLLAFQRAIVTPSRRNDLLAAASIVLAIVARTQFVVLAAALPVVIVVDAWSPRAALRAHRLLAALYAAAIIIALVLTAGGHSVFGTYSAAVHGNSLTLDLIPSVAEHLATIALGLAIIPFLLGGAWLAANVVRSGTRERRVFAMLATLAIVLLTFEVASYDLRFGGGLVRERYLFYVVPLILIAFCAVLAEGPWPRRSLAIPLVIFSYGLLRDPLPVFQKLNVDTPASVLDNYLVSALGGLTTARVVLIAAAFVAAILVLEGSLLLRRMHLAFLLAAFALIVLPAETGYAFARLFRINGTSGRPLTHPGSQIFEWVDKTVGSDADVTAIPYPTVPGDYWASAGFWWDLEFWNKSVDRSAGVPGIYEWTPNTFPKLALRFDRTGRASISPPGYVAQTVSDTRFQIAGAVVTNNRGLFLVKPDEPWHTDWIASGLWNDGWTKPGAPARIRVFAYPGQATAVSRSLSVYARAPDGIASRPFALRSNAGAATAAAGGDEVISTVSVCVPRHGFADVRLSTPTTSPIYGDLASQVTVGLGRQGGVLVTRIYLSGQVGPRCHV